RPALNEVSPRAALREPGKPVSQIPVARCFGKPHSFPPRIFCYACRPAILRSGNGSGKSTPKAVSPTHLKKEPQAVLLHIWRDFDQKVPLQSPFRSQRGASARRSDDRFYRRANGRKPRAFVTSRLPPAAPKSRRQVKLTV